VRRPARAPDWPHGFSRADVAAERALVAALESEPTLGELHAARTLWDVLPASVPLVVASSMPIRDLESSAGARQSTTIVHANRGANGIDGTISTALGVAQAAGGRAALLIGDVAFLHDLNALVAARTLGLSLTVLLVNNDGGGIFSFLEVAAHVEASSFETLWGTPHGVRFGPLVQALGARHQIAPTRTALQTLLAGSFRASGVEVIEVQTRRDENVAAHRRVFAAVGASLEGRPWRASS
jgi:2-succinyl-5-enolpyruvyl-6-hydroxy-3-cyclohexene-1-carboxylate synthase